MRLTDDLCDLSVYLSTLPHEKRQNVLRQQLSQMNKRFRHMDKGTGILFPMGHGMMERVIRDSHHRGGVAEQSRKGAVSRLPGGGEFQSDPV